MNIKNSIKSLPNIKRFANYYKVIRDCKETYEKIRWDSKSYDMLAENYTSVLQGLESSIIIFIDLQRNEGTLQNDIKELRETLIEIANEKD